MLLVTRIQRNSYNARKVEFNIGECLHCHQSSNREEEGKKSVEKIDISPVLLQKGSTKIALYGLGKMSLYYYLC